MPLVIRRARPEDAPVLGPICYEAFRSIAEAHGFPPDLPNAEVATGLISQLASGAATYGLVAELDGRVVGSNFLDERSGRISGVGPITIDPAVQNQRVGRALMEAVMTRSDQAGFAGIRLVQAGYHTRSLALYAALGFEIREHLSCLQGPALGFAMPGYEVRPAAVADLAACNVLCARIHGHDRGGELEGAIAQGAARIVVRDGRITGYATLIAFFGHAVAETNDDLKAIIAAAEAFLGPGFLLPSRNGELLRWCMAHGLKIVQPMTLMAKGLYNKPSGAWLPSVIY